MIELECKFCGSSFEVYPSKSDKQYCCRDCWSSDSRVEKNCSFCKDEFWTYRSEDTEYCSDECYREDNKLEFCEVECENCGNTFMKKKNQIKHYPKHYCDKSCKAIDINRVSNDFNYDLYGPDWQNSRSQAMKRDNQSCRICGKSNKRLEVHHIKKRVDSYDEEKGRFIEDINSMDNLVTLCADHHKKLEGKFSSCSTDEFVEKSKDLLQS